MRESGVQVGIRRFSKRALDNCHTTSSGVQKQARSDSSSLLQLLAGPQPVQQRPKRASTNCQQVTVGRAAEAEVAADASSGNAAVPAQHAHHQTNQTATDQQSGRQGQRITTGWCGTDARHSLHQHQQPQQWRGPKPGPTYSTASGQPVKRGLLHELPLPGQVQQLQQLDIRLNKSAHCNQYNTQPTVSSSAVTHQHGSPASVASLQKYSMRQPEHQYAPIGYAAQQQQRHQQQQPLEHKQWQRLSYQTSLCAGLMYHRQQGQQSSHDAGKQGIASLSMAPRQAGNNPLGEGSCRIVSNFDHWGDSASNWMDDSMIGIEGAPRNEGECWEGVGRCAVGPCNLR